MVCQQKEGQKIRAWVDPPPHHSGNARKKTFFLIEAFPNYNDSDMLCLCLGYFIHLCNTRLLYMCWDIGVILALRADPINIRLSWRCRRRRRHSGTSDLNIYSALPHTLRAQTAMCNFGNICSS